MTLDGKLFGVDLIALIIMLIVILFSLAILLILGLKKIKKIKLRLPSKLIHRNQVKKYKILSESSSIITEMNENELEIAH